MRTYLCLFLVCCAGCPQPTMSLDDEVDGGDAVVGMACQSHGDCAAGLRCVEPVGAGASYCTRPCSAADTCEDLAQASYIFQVPTTVTPQAGDTMATVWNTEYLARATVC